MTTRHDLRHRLRDRRHRDELRDAGVALSQPLFRQRHLYLGVADLDRADGADARLLPRRLARRPHRLAQRAGGDRAGGLALHAGAALVRAAPARAAARRHRRRAHRQPRRLGGDPAVSGDLLRHVFAVRDPADAALGAELRHGLGHGLRRLDLRLDRRHARHHVLPDPDHRHARDHAVARRRRRRLRADPAGARPLRTQGRRGRRRAADRDRRPRRSRLRQRRADRRERARRDPQAQGRPPRPCRERVQRHLHHASGATSSS